MKQSFARQHSRHRDRTPSVICLPPPKPPVAAPRPMTVVPEAVSAPDVDTPATERSEIRAPEQLPQNRQARRKAERAQAKALRREGLPPVARPARAAEPIAAPVAEVPPPEAGLAEKSVTEPHEEPTPIEVAPALPSAGVAATADGVAPLPRARSLVTAKPRGLALFVRRLGTILGLRRTTRQPAPVPPDGAIAGQLRALRSDLAMLQQSVDRMIDGIA